MRRKGKKGHVKQDLHSVGCVEEGGSDGQGGCSSLMPMATLISISESLTHDSLKQCMYTYSRKYQSNIQSTPANKMRSINL